MAAHLTDKQKKLIIADYVELGNYNAVARRHDVSKDTVKRIVTGNANIAQKAQEKKEQNTLEMLAYMDANKMRAQAAIDKLLDAMMEDSKIAAAPLNQIATAFGILVDKFVKSHQENPDTPLSDDRLLQALEAAAQNFSCTDDSDLIFNGEVVKRETPPKPTPKR